MRPVQIVGVAPTRFCITQRRFRTLTVSMDAQLKLLRRDPAQGEATVMFLDIRGFSKLFERNDPMDVWEFANTVLSALAEVVEDSHGAVDKFTGDGFLAHFGILTPSPTHVRDACECALRIRRRVEELNRSRRGTAEPEIEVGLGIHTGVLVSGVIATPVKAEFTVFGSVVNFASRIEGLTKEFGVDCLVSEAVHTLMGRRLSFQKMPERPIRGFAVTQATYWLAPSSGS